MKFTLRNEKYLKIAIQVLVGLTFLTPLVVFSHYYFPFITPRNWVFRTLVEILVVLYLILIAHNRAYLPKKNIIWILLAAFTAVLTLSSAFGGDFGYSFWSNYERMEGLVTMYHLLAFLVVIFGTCKERLEWERLLQMSIFVALIVAFVGLSQLVGVNILLESSGGSRISSTLGNATYLSSYLLIHLFLALYFLLKTKERTDLSFLPYGFSGLAVVLIVLHVWAQSRGAASGIIVQLFASPLLWVPFLALMALGFAQYARHRIDVRQARAMVSVFYSLSAVLFLSLLMTTQTRGAIVGLGIAMLAACLMLLFRKGETMSIRVTAALAIVVAVTAVWGIFANRESVFVKQQPLLQKIASISLTDATTQSRLATWGASYRAFLDKPVFGWGVENFHKAFNLYFPTVIYQDEGNPLWFDRPHNLLFQYLVEGGAIGFLTYLAFLACVIVLLIRNVRERRLGILLASFLIAYIGQNLFVFDSINSYIPFFLALGFMAFLVTPRAAAPEAIRPVSRTFLGGIAVIIGIFIIGIATYQGRAMAMNYHFVTFYRDQLSQPGKYNAEATKAIFNLLDTGPRLGRAELLGVYSEFAVGVLRENAAPEYDIAPMVTGLIERFEKLIAENPGDARLNLFLMNLYINAENLDPKYLDRVFTLSEETLRLSSTRPQIYYITGRAHILKGENDAAIADFKKAVALAPDVFDAHWNLFAALASLGRHEEAAAEVATLKQLRRFEREQYIRVASVYASSKNFTAAETIITEALQALPDDTELIATLAQIYAAQGKNAEARALIEKLVKLDPRLAPQAEEFYRLLEQGEFKN